MEIVLAADKDGQNLKNVVKQHMLKHGYKIIDVTENQSVDAVDATILASKIVNDSSERLGIVIDNYGVASFMTATKIKGMIAAEVSDERSAYMTRGHNNARLITMGAKVVGEELAKNIAIAFVTGTYDGGRHQVRVDMLNKMC